MNKIVMITGASSGIGKSCAEKFAREGYDIIVTGRRSDRLSALKKELELSANIQVLTLSFDVRDREAVNSVIASIPNEWTKIDVLVNNAGLALGRESFEDADMDDWDTMLNTNVNGLLNVSRAVLPHMVKAGTGHIINIGSIAGKEVYEKGNVYCATKFAVDALTRSMRIDLLKHNIKVTAVHPGAVETEFSLVRFKGDSQKAAGIYQGYTPLSGDDVADAVYYCAALPPHVCINDLVITCTSQANAFYLNKEI